MRPKTNYGISGSHFERGALLDVGGRRANQELVATGIHDVLFGTRVVVRKSTDLELDRDALLLSRVEHHAPERAQDLLWPSRRFHVKLSYVSARAGTLVL